MARRSKRDSPHVERIALAASRDSFDFDYSKEEWTAIESAILQVRPSAVSDLEKSALRREAAAYCWGLSFRPLATKYFAPHKMAKDWEAIRKQCKKLRDQLEKLNWQECQLERIVGNPPTNDPDMDEILLHLAKLQQKAGGLSALAALPMLVRTQNFSRREDPAVIFQQQILWLWTHQFGGDLSFSIDKYSDVEMPYGPLPDYLMAVAKPLMMDRAPRLSGLRALIDRQKRFYAWLEAQNGKRSAVPQSIKIARREDMGK